MSRSMLVLPRGISGQTSTMISLNRHWPRVSAERFDGMAVLKEKMARI